MYFLTEQLQLNDRRLQLISCGAIAIGFNGSVLFYSLDIDQCRCRIARIQSILALRRYFFNLILLIAVVVFVLIFYQNNSTHKLFSLVYSSDGIDFAVSSVSFENKIDFRIVRTTVEIICRCYALWCSNVYIYFNITLDLRKCWYRSCVLVRLPHK